MANQDSKGTGSRYCSKRPVPKCSSKSFIRNEWLKEPTLAAPSAMTCHKVLSRPCRVYIDIESHYPVFDDSIYLYIYLYLSISIYRNHLRWRRFLSMICMHGVIYQYMSYYSTKSHMWHHLFVFNDNGNFRIPVSIHTTIIDIGTSDDRMDIIDNHDFAMNVNFFRMRCTATQTMRAQTKKRNILKWILDRPKQVLIDWRLTTTDTAILLPHEDIDRYR